MTTTKPVLEEHGEHYCGSIIVFDPQTELHCCTGMCDDPDLVIEPSECAACDDTLGERTEVIDG